MFLTFLSGISKFDNPCTRHCQPTYQNASDMACLPTFEDSHGILRYDYENDWTNSHSRFYSKETAVGFMLMASYMSWGFSKETMVTGQKIEGNSQLSPSKASSQNSGSSPERERRMQRGPVGKIEAMRPRPEIHVNTVPKRRRTLNSIPW